MELNEEFISLTRVKKNACKMTQKTKYLSKIFKERNYRRWEK